MKDTNWARLLAYVTGLVNQKLLLQNEYLSAESWAVARYHHPARTPTPVTLGMSIVYQKSMDRILLCGSTSLVALGWFQY
jgi:hypothetical protein